MGISYKDYYEILGVERGAAADQIRKAHRRLAKKYHPDVNKEAGAEQKYKDVNEAYEVLKDPDKRQRYDALGENWEQEFSSAPPGWRDAQTDFGGGNGGGFSDFFRTIFGSFNMGNFAGNAGETVFASRPRDLEVSLSVSLDDLLSDRLMTITMTYGQNKTSTLNVHFPRGVIDGSRIKLAGKAPGGRDLNVTVRLLPHPVYEFNGHDIVETMKVAPWEAVLGCNLSVETPAGSVRMKLPPGTQNGQRLRLKGKGLPKRAEGESGDLYVRIELAVPKKLSEDEKKLWLELSKVSDFDPRGPRS